MTATLREALVERWFDTENADTETITDEQILARIEDLVGEGWWHAGHESERAEKALAEYEAAVMGTLARLPNHWQQYRDPLELGEGIREARRLGRAAFDRRLERV